MTGWLARIPKPPRDTMLSRIAPWRHEFMQAIAAGYTWAQLAQSVAPQPEIGVTTTAEHLRKCVRAAFALANEPFPGTRRRRHRRRAQKSATPETKPTPAAAEPLPTA
jgi:hypothetical protein